MTIPANPVHAALIALIRDADTQWEQAATLKTVDARLYREYINSSVQCALQRLRQGIDRPTASDDAWHFSVQDSMFRYHRKVGAAVGEFMFVRYLASAIIDLETRLFGRGLIEVKA